MTTPAPAPAAAAPVPGKTLGIVGLILAFLTPLIGFIISLIARSQSKKAGVSNGPATAGIVIGLILTILYIVLIVVVPLTLFSACNGLQPGVYDTGNGGTLTCG